LSDYLEGSIQALGFKVKKRDKIQAKNSDKKKIR
jgi:hypothetical protein